MNHLINTCWALLAIVLIAQVCHVFARNDDIIVEPPPSNYGVIGTCVDISDFITDVEIVNGIDCCCIILNCEIIYVK